MRIVVNDEAVALPRPMSLAEVLVHLGYDGAVVAVAVDGVFVPRAAHATTWPGEQARIEIVAPMAGG